MGLTLLVPLYGSFLLINLIYCVILYFRNGQRLYQIQSLAYFSFCITLLLQGGAMNADYLWRGLTASTVFFGLLAFSRLLTQIQRQKRFPIKKYLSIYAAGMLVTIVLNSMGVGINWMILPCLLGATYPMFETSYFEIFEAKEKLSFVTKCFIGAGVIYSLHMLDYAYAVDKPEFLFYGFFFACLCIFTFITFSNTSVIESIMFENAYYKMQVQYKVMLTNSSKLASLGEMAGGMAHEINNPLAVIQLQSDLLKRSLSKDNEDRKASLGRLENISEALNRISKVITNLRHFSRDTSNDPMTTASIKDIVNQTLSFCKMRFADNGIQIVHDEIPDFEIRCRPFQLAQVMLNLLNNSFESLNKVDASDKMIRIEVEKLEGSVKIRIIDNGKGIPQSIRERIFDPFFTTKEVGDGMGLGLSVSLGMIEAQNGTLTLEPAQDRTSFLIELPVTYS